MPRFTIAIETEADTGGFKDAETAAKSLSKAIETEMASASESAEKAGSRIRKALSFAKTAGGVGFKLFGGLVSAAQFAVGGVVKAFSVLAGLVQKAFSVVVSVARTAFDAIVGLAKGAVSLIGKAFGVLGDTIGLVFNRVTAVVAAATAFVVGKLGQQAAKYEQLKKAGDSMAKGIGSNMDAMAKAVKKGALGAISQLEAMRLANNSMLFEIVDGTDEMENYTAAAVRLGAAVGRDATSSIESLIIGIARQSRLWLDNIGLIVKAEEAYKAFADTVGKTVSELTESEKRLAFQQATLAAVDDAVSRLGERTDLLANKFGRLRAAISDTFLDAARVVGPALGILADAVNPLVATTREWIAANRELVASNLEAFATRVAAVFRGLVEFVPQVVGKVRELATVAGEGLSTAWEKAREIGTKALRGIFLGAVLARDAVRDLFEQGLSGPLLTKALQAAGDQIQVLALRAADAFATAFETVAVGITQTVNDLRNQIDRLNQLAITAKRAIPAALGIQTGFRERMGLVPDRDQERLVELQLQRRSAPVTAEGLQAGIAERLVAAQERAAVSSAALGEEVSARIPAATAAQERAAEVLAGARDRFAEFTGVFADGIAKVEEMGRASIAADEQQTQTTERLLDFADATTRVVRMMALRAESQEDRVRELTAEIQAAGGVLLNYNGAPAVGGR